MYLLLYPIGWDSCYPTGWDRLSHRMGWLGVNGWDSSVLNRSVLTYPIGWGGWVGMIYPIGWDSSLCGFDSLFTLTAFRFSIVRGNGSYRGTILRDVAPIPASF